MLKKAQKFVPILLGVIFVIFLGFVGYYYYKFKNQKDSQKEGLDKVLAVVGGEKITQRDLNELIYGIDFQGSVERPGQEISDERKKELLNQLIEWTIVRKEAEKLGVVIGEEDIFNYIKENVPGFDNYTEEQKNLTKKTVKNLLLVEKIKEKITGWREGKVILVRFDRAYQESLPDTENKYKRDKEYASKLVNEIYQKIISGEISFEEGMQKADNDPVLGKKAWESPVGYTFSFAFSKEDSVSRGILSSSPDFWDKVFSYKKGEVSKPQIGSIYFDTDKVTREAFYFIVKIEDSNEGAKNYEEWLNEKLKEYNVTIY